MLHFHKALDCAVVVSQMKFSGTADTAYNCFHIGGENKELLAKLDVRNQAVGHCIVNVDNQNFVCRLFVGYYLYFCHRMEKIDGKWKHL